MSARRVTVCGAGQQGLAMAAHLALNGERVAIWNRTFDHISNLAAGGKISLTGVIRGNVPVDCATSNVHEALSDLVMVVTPASAHRDIAKMLAPYVHPEMLIVLNPGRSFGAIEFYNTLAEFEHRQLPVVAETQTIVYTCRRTSDYGVHVYALKKEVPLAAIGMEAGNVIDRLPLCLKEYFKPVNSVLETSFANVGMILHCAPVLMNVGWIETDKVDFKYYYDGISRSIAEFLQECDNERLATAAAYGVKVESLIEWLKRVYGAVGDTIHQCIASTAVYKEIDAPSRIDCRYITEDVPCGLVPIECAARAKGVASKHISLLIDLANALLKTDFRKSGRTCMTARVGGLV